MQSGKARRSWEMESNLCDGIEFPRSVETTFVKIINAIFHDDHNITSNMYIPMQIFIVMSSWMQSGKARKSWEFESWNFCDGKECTRSDSN